MVIFRENTEDIYAGIEFEAGSAENESSRELFKAELPGRDYAKIRFPDTSGIGIKPVSRGAPSGCSAPRSSTRSVNKRKSVTIVHKGNIMKFTEGAFRNWSYALAEREFPAPHREQWERTKGRQGREGGERRAGRGEEGRQGKVIIRTRSPTSRCSRC